MCAQKTYALMFRLGWIELKYIISVTVNVISTYWRFNLTACARKTYALMFRFGWTGAVQIAYGSMLLNHEGDSFTNMPACLAFILSNYCE